MGRPREQAHGGSEAAPHPLLHRQGSRQAHQLHRHCRKRQVSGIWVSGPHSKGNTVESRLSGMLRKPTFPDN